MFTRIPLRCPRSGQTLHLAPADAPGFAERLAARRADALLTTPEGTIAYPVVDGIPLMRPSDAIGDDLPPSPVSLDRATEIADETETYDALAGKDRGDVGDAARRLFTPALVANRGAGGARWPDPLSVWVDSSGSADTQYEAYRFLAPMEDATFLQFGGSGSHAVKALLGGARLAGLLTPSLGEAQLGRDLARWFGVEDRFFAVCGIGEAIPLGDGTVDRIYGGGCLHHTDVRDSVRELGRVLRSGGRASFVDPRQNPIYETWLRVFGRLRFCGEEEHVHDHPLDVGELRALGSGTFRSIEALLSGGPVRYAMVFANRTAGLRPSPAVSARILGAERRLLNGLGLDRMFGTMAVLMHR